MYTIILSWYYFWKQEEGSQPGNRISEFAKLVRDKGGKFTDELLEAKDGTFLIPNNEVNYEEIFLWYFWNMRLLYTECL